MSDRYLFTMSRIQNRILRHIKGELKREGLSLSPGQMGVLIALNDSGGALMGELSRTLDMDNAALTRLVAGLEKQGLVSREINPANRRQIRVTISPDGKRQAGVLIPIVRNANDLISRGFSPEEMALYNRVNQAILDKFN